MEIRLTSHHVKLTEGLKELAERRCDSALSAFETHIVRVEFTLSDAKGRTGGEETKCHAVVKLDNGERVVLEKTHAKAGGAISLATHGLKNTLGRMLGKRTSGKRHRQPLKTMME